MRVLYNTDDEHVRLTEASSPKYSLSQGHEYLVLAISSISKSETSSGRVLYQVLNDFGGISHVPADLFEISDGKCSSYWEARFDKDGSLLLWPEEFYVGFFHDDLSEGYMAAIEVLKDVVMRLREE